MLENYFLLYLWMTFTTFLNMFFTVSGSGIVNPISAVLTDPYRAIGIGYLIYLISGVHRVYLFRKNVFEDKNNIKYLKIMIPFSILGALSAGLIISHINLQLMTILIILSSIFFIYKTAVSIFKNSTKSELENSKNAKVNHGAPFVAFFTGFLQGSALPGADMRNNYLRSYISEVSVRAVGSSIALFNFLTVSIVLLFNSKILHEDLIFMLTLVPVLFITQIYAKKILVKLKDRDAKLIALVMSILSLIVLIVSLIK